MGIFCKDLLYKLKIFNWWTQTVTQGNINVTTAWQNTKISAASKPITRRYLPACLFDVFRLALKAENI